MLISEDSKLQLFNTLLMPKLFIVPIIGKWPSMSQHFFDIFFYYYLLTIFYHDYPLGYVPSQMEGPGYSSVFIQLVLTNNTIIHNNTHVSKGYHQYCDTCTVGHLYFGLGNSSYLFSFLNKCRTL